MRLLRTHPLRTNASTAAVVTFAGDGIAQRIEHWARSRQAVAHDSSVVFAWDGQRAAVMTGFWGPQSLGNCYWFAWLDRRFPTHRGPSWATMKVLGKKLLVHQWSWVPFTNGLFYVFLVCAYSGLDTAPTSQRRLAQDVWTKISTELWPTQMRSVFVWGVAHSFNFLFLPTHARVLFNSTVQVGWVAYLSVAGHR